jgi:hypothetical protein
MMQISHERLVFNDIWTVIADNVSLFQYCGGLATWFFGLNSVWFEHVPNRGTSLELS